MSHPATFLRRVLAIDSIGCAVSGIGLIAGAAIAAPVLGVSVTLLESAGAALLPFAAYLGWLASRETPPAMGVWTAIAINVAWVVESLLLAAGAWGEPTTSGSAVIAGQALIGATLAELEYVGLKRLRLRAA